MTDQVRIGDAEREAASRALSDHVAQGRLTADEHAERLDRIWAARTRADLGPVFSDLPSRYAEQPPRAYADRPTSGRRTSDRYWSSGLRPFRRGLPTPLVVVLAVLLALTVLTHLPLLLLGLGVCWFVSARHRRWHHRSWRY